MRVVFLVLLSLTLAFAGQATAAASPAIYFLKDVEDQPVGDGTLDVVMPDPADLENPANNTPPSVRLVNGFIHEQFVRPTADNNTGFLSGPVIIGLWAPETPLVDEAVLVIEFCIFTPGTNPLMQDATVLASARVPIEGGNITPPDPMKFVPPNPTDPEQSANHIAAQAIIYAAPMLLQAPYVLLLENNGTQVLSQEMDPAATVGVRFMLEPPEGSAIPIATGSQPIEYDFGLAPSFVYVPWFTPEEPQPSGSGTTSTSTSTTTSKPPTTLGPGEEEEEKDSPIGFLLPIGLLGVAFMVRRKLR